MKPKLPAQRAGKPMICQSGKLKLISHGAEAKIFLDERNNFIIKDRIPKSYRIPELDEKIRSRRTKSEEKLLLKASEILNCPKPFFCPPAKNSTKLKMPYIKGQKLSEHLNKFQLQKQKKICGQIGKSVAKLHDKGVIHGDLTTSNMILTENKIYFIDFGLGYISQKPEDKAVDIHLFRQALEAKHFRNWKKLYKEFERGYKQKNPDAEKVFSQLIKVEKRGRYKG